MENQNKTEEIVSVIIEAIQEKKGEEIVDMDLSKLDDAVCEHFIICHASNPRQVKAIADEVTFQTKNTLNEPVWQTEGYEAEEWIVLDYFNIVVHLFLKEKRGFYNLEELWCDAKVTNH